MRVKLLPLGFLLAFTCLSALAIGTSHTLWAEPSYGATHRLDAGE